MADVRAFKDAKWGTRYWHIQNVINSAAFLCGEVDPGEEEAEDFGFQTVETSWFSWNGLIHDLRGLAESIRKEREVTG